MKNLRIHLNLGLLRLSTSRQKKEVPTTFPELFDRLVIVDSTVKENALFNYEQTYIYGLRLLSAITCCLDSMLLLQIQYKFQDLLLQQQKDNILEGGSEIIRDMLSVERNYLLVKSYVIGGPSERNLPGRTIIENTSNPYPHTMFHEYPVPREYCPVIPTRSAIKQDSGMVGLLSTTLKPEDGLNWLVKCREALCRTFASRADSVGTQLLQDLLEKSVQVLCNVPDDAIFPLLEYAGNESLVKSFQLSAMEEEGVHVAVRYGLHLKLLAGSKEENTEKLTFVMQQSGYFLHQQKRQAASTPRSMQECSTGMDWFVATIFLLMQGNEKRVWSFLHGFSAVVHSAYLWSHRLHRSAHLPHERVQGGIMPLFSSSCHNVELILQEEVPQVYSAFRMSGFAPSQICQQWLRQCFWNYLDWIDICHYLAVCLVLGVDYQVYMCVAILKSQQKKILQHMQSEELIVFMKEEPLTGFKVADNVQYMQQLEKKYRKTILGDMLNISQP